MAFGKLESEIIGATGRECGAVEKIESLFKNGADPNAIEKEPDEIDSEDGEPYYRTLFNAVLFNNYQYNDNSCEHNSKCVDLLKSFIDNGLDTRKYGSSIIKDLRLEAPWYEDIFSAYVSKTVIVNDENAFTDDANAALVDLPLVNIKYIQTHRKKDPATMFNHVR